MLHLGRLSILASFCAFTGMVMTPNVIALTEAEIDQSARQTFISQIPLDKLPDQLRNKLTYVIGRAQLFEKGKSEAFPCNPEVYRWLLESPDASLFAWKKLGATKAGVTRLENGSFLGTDGNGGEMRWSLIATGPTTRIDRGACSAAPAGGGPVRSASRCSTSASTSSPRALAMR